MYRRITSKLFLPAVISAFVAIFATGNAAYGADSAQASSQNTISVLFTDKTIDKEILKEFRAKGIHVDWFKASISGKLKENLKKDLSSYNVLVLKPSEGSVGWTEEVKKFLSQGGGVFFIGDNAGPAGEKFYTSIHGKDPVELLRFFREKLGYYGPIGPALTDPKVAAGNGELSDWWKGFGYSLTDNIPASPVSAGVRNVWYPNWWWGVPEWKLKQNGGMKLDGPWQAVLRSNRSAAGKKEDAPVLMAIREYGAGRVAATPIAAIHYFNSANHPTIKKRVYSQGLNNIPSDFHKLLENTIRWLAEPSIKSGSLGGFTLKDEQLNPKPWVQSPTNWKDFDGHEKRDRWLRRTKCVARGMIGCQSKHSVGQSTVAEFAKAAREAGLDFIVFLEDFARMTEEKLKQLEQDCLDASKDGIICFPGLLITDNADHTCYYFGRELVWPPKKCLTPDGKGFNNRITKSTHEEWKKHARGMGVLQFTHNESPVVKCPPDAFPQAFGYCNFTPVKESAPIWDLRLYGSIAFEFVRDGQVIDSVEDIRPQFGGRPIAVNLIKQAGGLKKAINSGCFLNYVYYPGGYWQVAENPSARQIMKNLSYHGWALSAYISSQPIIHAWFANPNTPYNGGGYQASKRNGQFVSMPNMRSLLGFDVSSPAGLKEIIIWSGGKIYRRYLPGGQKRFQKVLDCLHDRGRGFVLEVIDQENKKAVSDGIGIGSNFYHAECSDRINNQELVRGPFHFGNRSRIVAGFKYVAMPPFTDAHPPHAGLDISTWPFIENADGTAVPVVNQKWDIPLVADNGRMIGVNCFKDYLPDEMVKNGWHTYGPLTAPRTLKMRQMLTEFFPLDALSSEFDFFKAKHAERSAVLDVEIEFVREFKPKKLDVFYINFPGKDYLFATVSPQSPGCNACGKWKSFDRDFVFPLRTNCFFAGIPLIPESQGGGMFIMLEGTPHIELRKSGEHPDGRRVTARIPDILEKGVSKGTKVKYRFLIIGNNSGERPDNLSYYSGIHQFLGFNGKAGYDLKLSQGKIVSQQGVLKLRAESGAVEFNYSNPGLKRRIRLPIMVEGLNDDWTSIVWWFGRACPIYPAASEKGKMPLAIDADKPAHMLIGHPVVADNKELMIQFVQMYEKPAKYHIYANNTTDKTITATISKSMDLPGFTFTSEKITLEPGADWIWEK